MTADKERGKEVDEKERRGGSYGMTSSGHKAYKEGDVLAHQQRLENSSRQRLVDGGDAEWHGNAAAVGDGSVREEELEEEGSFASSDGCVYFDNCNNYTACSSEAQDWMPQQHQWNSETLYFRFAVLARRLRELTRCQKGHEKGFPCLFGSC